MLSGLNLNVFSKKRDFTLEVDILKFGVNSPTVTKKSQLKPTYIHRRQKADEKKKKTFYNIPPKFCLLRIFCY